MFYTIVAAIDISTFITGILFMLMGYIKLDNLILFITCPAISGFFTGTYQTIVKGGIGAVTQSLSLSHVISPSAL